MNPSPFSISRSSRPSPGDLAASPDLRPQPGVVQRWSEALRQARSDADGERAMSHLLELASWPELTDLPHAIASPLTRICALLSYRRTSGLLVHRMLDMPPEETRALLYALVRLGHVRFAQGEGGTADRAAEKDPLLPPLKEESILAKFWRRLSGRS